jgi:hypothetical protein
LESHGDDEIALSQKHIEPRVAIPPVSWIGFAWFIIIAFGGFTAFGYLSQTVATP